MNKKEYVIYGVTGFVLLVLILNSLSIMQMQKQINALTESHLNSTESSESNQDSIETQINIHEINIYKEPVAEDSAEIEIIEDLEEEIIEPLEYTEDELYLLSHLIGAEAGSDSCTYDLMLYTGSVVLNRMKHKDFPDTMKEVIYQPGQYSCVSSGSFYKEPTKRSVRAAEELLEHGSVLPDNVVFQSQFVQGDEIYCKEQNTYFCTKED